MLLRTTNGDLISVDRHAFTSDREYYMFIKSIVTGGSPKPQYRGNIIERLTNIIKQK